MNRKSASKARQLAVKEVAALSQIVQVLVAHQREMIQGKATQLLVKCGKKNCRCARGERHLAYFLYLSRGGPPRRLWVPAPERAWVRETSERYRGFRATRAELNRSFKRLLAHLDALEAALTAPYERAD